MKQGMITIGYEDKIPPVVIWSGGVFIIESDNDGTGTHIGDYSFIIPIDEVFIEHNLYEVNQEFLLENQRFAITAVELNPVHTRVIIETDWMNNTKSLQRLILYMENEHGDRFDPPAP